MENKHLLESFKNALNGIFYTLKTQRNFKIMILTAFLVVFLAYLFDFSLEKWLILLLIIGLVLVFEVINTGIEVLLDHLFENKYDEHIKIIKNVFAGAVLLIALFSLLLGFLLFFF